MQKTWKKFINSSPQTKWFLFNWFFYGFLLLVTLIYCYARLDFVRSGPKTIQEQTKQ